LGKTLCWYYNAVIDNTGATMIRWHTKEGGNNGVCVNRSECTRRCTLII